MTIDQALQWIGVIAAGTLLGNLVAMAVRRATRREAAHMEKQRQVVQIGREK